MESPQRIYDDRRDAGAGLSRLLSEYAGRDTVVLGLPRGGVVVAAEIAKALKCGLDIIFAGKLRAPFNPELAIGAVTEDGNVYLNRSALAGLHIKEDYIEKEKRERLEIVRERLRLYRQVKKKVPLVNKTAIITDDGLATGSTMISAIQAVYASKARRIIVAVPGGPADTVERIREMKEVQKIVCPVIPTLFFAVSQLYADFRQVEDIEVIEILKEFAAEEEGRG